MLEDAGEEIDRRVEEKLKAHFERLQQEQEQARSAQTVEQRERAFDDYMQTIKDKLYKLTPDGRIKKSPINDQPVFTEAGALFAKEYQELMEIASPNADLVKIAKQAYKTVERLTGNVAPAKSKAEEAAEKKKKFLEKRKHESGVAGNKTPATTQDKFNSGNKVRLFEAMLEDESNADNPDLAQYRK